MRQNLAQIFIGLPVVGPVLIADPLIRSASSVFDQSSAAVLETLSRTYRFSFAGYVNTGAPTYFTPVAAAGRDRVPAGRQHQQIFHGQRLWVSVSGQRLV